MLKLSAIKEDLNNGSWFSFPTPNKWKVVMGTSTSFHSSKISILLGGDNLLFFPTKIEQDSQGLALYQSNLSNNYIVYGSVCLNIITWMDPLLSTSTLFIKMLSIQDLQKQILLTISAEKFTDPSANTN